MNKYLVKKHREIDNRSLRDAIEEQGRSIRFAEARSFNDAC